MLELIDRKNEIASLEKWLAKTGPTFVFIQGKGGLGKTRLINEIHKKYQKQYIILSLDIDTIYEWNNFGSLILLLIEEIKKSPLTISEDVENIRNKLGEWYKSQERNDSKKTLEEKKNALFDSLNKVLENGFIFSIDTCEKFASNTYALDILFELIKYLPQEQGRYIFSGRPLSKKASVRSIFSPWKEIEKHVAEISSSRPHKLDIKPFSKEDSLAYLKAKEKSIFTKLPDASREDLIQLSGGKPIILDLAVDLLSRSPDNIIEGIKNEKSFEKSLVQYLHKLQDPLNRLIALLAHVYPVSKNEIAKLLEITPKVAHEIFDDAKNFTFVKLLPDGKITLHDEMREMIQKYVWGEIDKDKYLRIGYSELAEQLARTQDKDLYDKKTIKEKEYQKQIDETEQSVQQILEIVKLRAEREAATEKWVYHLGYRDPKAAFKETKELINRVRKGRKFVFAVKLLEHTSPWRDALNSDELEELEFMWARANVDLKKWDEAKKDLEALLSKTNNDTRKAQIYNQLGLVANAQGQFKKFLEHEEKVFNIIWHHPIDKGCNKNNFTQMISNDLWSAMNVANMAGYAARLLDDQPNTNQPNQSNENNPYLEKAIQYYDCAINIGQYLLRHYDTLDDLPERGITKKAIKNILASALNNKGYALALKDKRKQNQALALCQKALDIWTEELEHRQAAFAEISLGIINRDQGDYAGSIYYLEKSIEHLRNYGQEQEDAEYLCRAHFQLGWSYWFLSEKENMQSMDNQAEAHLQQAKEHLQQAKELAEAYNLKKDKPGIYHQLASVRWRLAIRYNTDSKKEARELNKDAIAISKELNNIRYFIDATVGEAEFDWDDGIYSRIDEYHKQISSYEEHSYYNLYLGRLARIQGDIAFVHDKDASKAIKYYRQGLEKIEKHGGYGPYSIDNELLTLAGRLGEDPNLALDVIKGLKQAWQDEGSTYLLDWAETLENLLELDLSSGVKNE